MRGLTPGRRFEVWQTENLDGLPCTWHPRDAGGVRLGDATAGTSGRLTFPFEVADVPAGPRGTELALWLLPVDGGPAMQAVTWPCFARGRLSGHLYGEDGHLYLRPLTVTARFTTPEGLLVERTATTSSGTYIFDGVPISARASVRVYEDGWLLAEKAHDPAHPPGLEVVLDFGASPSDPELSWRSRPIPLWHAPFSLPSPRPVASASPDLFPRVACEDEAAPVNIRGDVDNELAYRGGDELTLRARQVPPNTTFAVWLTGSIVGYKGECPPGPRSQGGVRIGQARSDEQGRLVQRLRLADLEHYNPFKEQLLWLVWPDGRTTAPVVRWDALVPSPVSGHLYDEEGERFTGPARVELYIQTAKRVLHRTTMASGGTYRFADVPAPADLELVVFQGDRRIARRQVRRDYLPPLANRLLPSHGTPIILDFGGPGGTADPWAPDFPLLLGP